MAYYRFYFMDVAGHFERVHEAVLDGDEIACAEALRLDHAYAIEIWDRERRVALVHPEHRRRR